MDTEDLYRENRALENANNEIYKEIKKFNWGAFGLGWIWGLFNGAYKQVVHPSLVLCAISFLPIIKIISNTIVWIGISIYFGIKGSEWAWEGKDWKDINHFREVQKKWAIAGIAAFITIQLVIPLITGALFLKNETSKFESGAEAVVYIITNKNSLKNATDTDSVVKELAEYMDAHYKKQNPPSKCELYNSNTIKISKYDNAENKYKPSFLYTIHKNGTCSLDSKNCYVISYEVKNGRAVFIEKLYFNKSGKTRLDDSLKK